MSLLDAVSDLLDEPTEAEPEPQAKHPRTIPPLPHRPSPEEALARCGPRLRERARQDPALLEEVRDYLAGGKGRTVEPRTAGKPAPVTDEEVEAAVAVAELHGWSREAFREWCGGDWSGLPDPDHLEGMLAVVVPQPGLSGAGGPDMQGRTG